MPDTQGKWTYGDGYTLINMISGDNHYAELKDYKMLEEWFASGVLRVIPFVDVFGSAISLRTDRVESIERHTPQSLIENERANDYEAERRHEKSGPSWQRYDD